MTDRGKKKLKDEVKRPTGRVRIRVRNVKTGKVQVIKEENLVVNNYRKQVLGALAGAELANRAISKIQLGTNPDAPTVGDVEVTGPVDMSLTPSYPLSKSVSFLGTLEAADGNGVTYREVGLCFENASPNLVARFAPVTIQKTEEVEVTITWTLSW